MRLLLLSSSLYGGPCYLLSSSTCLFTPLLLFFVCCVYVVPLIVLPCPWLVPVFGFDCHVSANIPRSFEDQRLLLFAFLSSSCRDVSDSSWVCEHFWVCDDVLTHRLPNTKLQISLPPMLRGFAFWWCCVFRSYLSSVLFISCSQSAPFLFLSNWSSHLQAWVML